MRHVTNHEPCGPLRLTKRAILDLPNHTGVKNLHLLLLHALLLLADVVEAALQVVAALQRLLELGLHVDDLRGGRRERPRVTEEPPTRAALKRSERTKTSLPTSSAVSFSR